VSNDRPDKPDLAWKDETPLLPIDSITVENRFRKRIGDLNPLVDSISALVSSIPC